MSIDVITDNFSLLLGGLWISARIAAISIVLALPLGLIVALLASAKSRWISWPTFVLVELFRGVPLLVLVYLVYFGLPSSGLTFEAEMALIISLVISGAAYTSEIFRSGLLNVPRGQREASRSLGLTGLQELRYIVVPQALRAVRIPIISFAVLIFQYTATGFAIGIPELLSRSYAVGSVTFDYLTVFILAGAMFAAVSIIASVLVHALRRDKSQPQMLPA